HRTKTNWIARNQNKRELPGQRDAEERVIELRMSDGRRKVAARLSLEKKLRQDRKEPVQRGDPENTRREGGHDINASPRSRATRTAEFRRGGSSQLRCRYQCAISARRAPPRPTRDESPS